MNEQIGVSGCFGGASAYPVDDIEDVEAAVEEIIGQEPPSGNGQAADETPDVAMALLVGQYVRRVRLLTWAVVVLAAVIAVKELK